MGFSAGALGGIRTPNLLIRSQMLYPLSYERRVEPEHFSAMGHPFRNRFRRSHRRRDAPGCSNEEVGERLGISPRTAKAHCDVLRQKLGVARRRQIPRAYRELTGDDPLSKASLPGVPEAGD